MKSVIEQPGRTRLASKFGWMLFGNIVYSLCQWGMLVLLARTGGVELLGVFALALAITAPVMTFSQLQLREIVATDTTAVHSPQEYLRLRLTMTALAFAAIMLASALMSGARAILFATLGVAAWKSVDTVGDVLYGFFQSKEQMHIVAISMLLKGPAALVALWATVRLFRSIGVSALTIAAVILLLTAAYDVRWFRRLWPAARFSIFRGDQPSVSAARVCRLAWLALPLGCVQAVSSLTVNIPRYALQSHFGSKQVGIYAALAYFIYIGQIAVGALGQSTAPRLARLMTLADISGFCRLVARLVAITVAIGAAGILGAWWFGNIALRLCYGAEYASSGGTLTLLFVAAAFAFPAWMIGAGLTAARVLRGQLAVLVCSALATSIASWAFVPVFGMAGAALSLAAGYFTQLLCSFALLARHLQQRRKQGHAMPRAAESLPCAV